MAFPGKGLEHSQRSGLENDNNIKRASKVKVTELVPHPSEITHSGQNPVVTDSAGEKQSKPIPPVHFYALESEQRILELVRPLYVVVYDPDMAFVRELEVYKAMNQDRPLKVYFLLYEESTEGRRFEASIRKENTAFENLIRQKATMAIPVDQVFSIHPCLSRFVLVFCLLSSVCSRVLRAGCIGSCSQMESCLFSIAKLQFLQHFYYSLTYIFSNRMVECWMPLQRKFPQQVCS